MTYTIEYAKYKALVKKKEEAKEAGNNDLYFELVRECRTSWDKIQHMLKSR